MKEVNYKELKKYSNLPKYDIGTVSINSGYQRNADQTQAGYFTQNAERVTNAFVPQAISSGVQNAASPLLSLGKSAANYINTYNNTIQEIGAKYGKLAAQQVGDEARNAVYNEGLNVAKSSAKSAASKALGAVNKALNAYSAIHGGYGLYENSRDSSTLTAGDLSSMGARSTEYANGVVYDRMGGFDEAGVNKYVSDQNKANKISGITSGLEAGAGIGGLIGSIFPGAGTLIGSGIGALVGTIGGGMFGHHAREKRKRAIEEAKRNYATAADAYNTQNESEAASTGLRNQYYATHADEGLGLNEGPVNALTQGGEPLVKVKYDKGGNPRVTAAGMFAITPETPERVDNIKIHASNNLGIIGNFQDPYTGERLAVETRPFVKMFNSNNPTEKAIGERGLLAGLDLQDKLKKEQKMMKADCGKGLHKYALGKDLNLSGIEIPAISWLANKLAYKTKEKEVDRMPVMAYNAYSPNPYLMQAGALMPTRYNIDPQMQALNDEARFANYAISQSAYSPGQKMSMLSNLYNKKMQNVTKLLGEKANQENTMRANYAKWLSDVGAQEQQLISAYRQKYYDYLAQAAAKKFDTKMSLFKGNIQNNNDIAQNAWNVAQANKTIGLYEQNLNNQDVARIAEIEKNAQKKYATGVPSSMRYIYPSAFGKVFNNMPALNYNRNWNLGGV